MIERRLVYIGKPGSKVFESQVVEFLVEVEKYGFFDKVILLLGIRDYTAKEHIQKIPGLEVIPFILHPNYHFYRRRQKRELNKILMSVLCQNTIIHTRGESFSLIIKSILKKCEYSNVNIITDVRGAVYEESLFYNKLKPGLHQLKLYQHNKNLKYLIRNTDYVSCVSEKLKEYVIRKTGIEKNKVFVNNCLAGREFYFSDVKRKKYRDKLNITNEDILFLFSTGGNSNWQNTKEIITSIAGKGYKVLNLSKFKIELKNVINLFVPYTEVPNYLNAADIGVVWRKNDVVNNVASPVKFSEYVCSGLPIVANKGVCLINDYIKKSGFGKTINNFDELKKSEIESLILLNRLKIESYANQYFSSNIITKNYMSMYKKILKIK